MDKTLIRLEVHKYVCYVLIKYEKGQLLSKAMQEKRLKYTNELINKLKHPLHPGMMWLLSDKKISCQYQKTSSQKKATRCHKETCAKSHADQRPSWS